MENQEDGIQSGDKETMFIVFIFVGILSLIVSLGFSIYTIHFLENSVRTTGKIIEMREKVDSEDESITMAPVFVFTDAKGVFHTNESLLSSNPPEHAVDDVVPVLYIPEKPEQARIDQFVYHWFGAIVTGGLGIIFLVVGLVGRHSKKRSGKSMPVPSGQ